MKVTLLGGGSAYFEQAVAEIATAPRLENVEFMFFDCETARMDVMRRIAERIVAKAGKGGKVRMTVDMGEALDGADFAISSIGVHGPDAAWHLIDSDVCAKHGILHTTGDTVGPAGLSDGLRIIPILVKIAKEMERRCPAALLLNHSNPMSPICRAVSKYTKIKAIGYCHNAYLDFDDFSKILEIPVGELEPVIGGTNHCGWLLSLKRNGEDLYPELERRLDAMDKEPARMFAYELFKLTGLYPIGGSRHLLEFYPHSRLLKDKKNLPYGQKWRSDMIKENLLQRELNKGNDSLEDKANGKGKINMAEHQSPEAMGRQIEALAFGPEITHFVNIPNNGAISNLPSWAVVELKAVLGGKEARPVYVGELPPQAARWTLAQLYAHELTVEAAVEQDRKKALMAMASDPMIQNFKEAETVFDALVEAQGERLKAFKR